MKILIVSNIFPPGFIGGYELGAYEVARGLAARGHTVTVLTSDYMLDDDGDITEFVIERSLETTISHENVFPVETTAAGTFVNWANIRRLASMVRRHEPELVINFNTAAIGPAGLYHFEAACGVPRISYFMDDVFGAYRVMGDHRPQYERVFGAPQLEHLGNVVAMSRNLTREMAQTIDAIEAAAEYIPGWVDIPTEEQLAVPRPDLGIGDEAKRRFVFCGRVAAHKGVDILIAAAKLMVQRGQADFVIDLYGAGQVTQFLQQIQREDLGQFVRYRGLLSKSEMLCRFADYDALVFPTWEREPFAFTICEAAAVGCIPVMTARIGAAEWFMDGIDSIKPARTVEAFADAMLRMIAMSDERLAEMKAAATSVVKANLQFERWLDKIEALSERTIKSMPPIDRDRIRAVEAAFLVLTQMWKENLS